MMSILLYKNIAKLKNFCYSPGKRFVMMESSSFIKDFVSVLQDEGYIGHSEDCHISKAKNSSFNIPMLKVFPLYNAYCNERKRYTPFQSMRFISKPSRRVYVSAKYLSEEFFDCKVGVISSNIGVISSRVAIERRCGGELLCEIF